ncbi:MAG TPA: glycosyltransferase, partial [Gemmatimonadales bacterium]|nr:glycosyltransferase [Gemmatimonadales bacterium]
MSKVIAHLIETDGPGGAERMLASLANEQQTSGHPGIAFVPARIEGWLESELRGFGVPIEYVPLQKPFSRAFAHELAAAFRRHRVALAHSHEFTMAFYGAWASRLAGVPHVITMHGSRYYAQRWRRRLAMRWAVGLSAAVTAVSHNLAESMRKDLWLRRGRVSVVPNGIRRRHAAANGIRRELGVGPEDRLVLSVGNLYPVKGHADLVTAVSYLAPRYPALHLAIAGRGELADTLNREANARRIADRVHLLGLRNDVAELLASADAFVLPSRSEGLPLALLEAMFAGLPIVATRVGEVPAALANGSAGLLVEPARPDELATAIERILTDAELA